MAAVGFDIKVPADSAVTLEGDLVAEGPLTIDFARGVVSGKFHAVNDDLVEITSTPIAQVGQSTGSSVAQEAAAQAAITVVPATDPNAG